MSGNNRKSAEILLDHIIKTTGDNRYYLNDQDDSDNLTIKFNFEAEETIDGSSRIAWSRL